MSEVTGPEYLTNEQTLGSSFCHMPGPGHNTFQRLFHNSPGRWVPSLFSCCRTGTVVYLAPRCWFVPLSMHQHIGIPGFHRPLVAFSPSVDESAVAVGVPSWKSETLGSNFSFVIIKWDDLGRSHSSVNLIFFIHSIHKIKKLDFISGSQILVF